MKQKLNLQNLEVRSFTTSKHDVTGGRQLPTDAEGCTVVETGDGCSSGGPVYVICRPCQ